jgi:hypothetical protein
VLHPEAEEHVMSYETDQFINQARIVFAQNDSRVYTLEARIYALEQFMARAEPFIKTMELIEPKEQAPDVGFAPR